MSLKRAGKRDGGDAPGGRFTYVSKRTSTRWYIGAWVVGVLASVVFFLSAHRGMTGTAFFVTGTTPLSVTAWVVAIIAAIVTLVAWIGALIRLGQIRRWGWFAAVLILQLIGLGIIGMIAYAVAGPPDEMVVSRPTTT
jgi:hypothetical protein